MARPQTIELADATIIPILYEDRSVIVIDKPAGWMLVPYNWDKTSRNLHLAISSSILVGVFWARSRSLKYLRNVHRLDADTSGVLLMARSPGALHTFSRLFESRRMEKKYHAILDGIPKDRAWTCELKIAPDAAQIGRRKIDARNGKDAETHFTVLATQTAAALVEARPITGRTHQIRLHPAAAGCPVRGGPLRERRWAASWPETGCQRPAPRFAGGRAGLHGPVSKATSVHSGPDKGILREFRVPPAEEEPSGTGRHRSTEAGPTP